MLRLVPHDLPYILARMLEDNIITTWMIGQEGSDIIDIACV
jgi:hypothetical protein